MRRICDADEIHIFDIELGMVSVEALHHRRIKIFDDREAPHMAWFQEIVQDQEAAVLCEGSCARDQK